METRQRCRELYLKKQHAVQELILQVTVCYCMLPVDGDEAALQGAVPEEAARRAGAAGAAGTPGGGSRDGQR